jgi:hypothetical protein
MAALTDAQPGLMPHVKTLVHGGKKESVDFVVECANGTVNASITVQLEYSRYFDMKYISEILVKIVAAHV